MINLLRKIKIPRQIVLLLILAVVLNIARVLFFHNNSFLWFLWNLFLAIIPFLISSFLFLNTNKTNIFKPIFIIGFILWLLFIPNAPYIITDFIHLGRIRVVPVMFDAFLIFSCAWAGLLLGLHSMLHIENIFLLKFSKKTTNIAMAVIILFTSFGVYLGRFLRFNSWDFFTSHTSIISSIWKVFTQSNDYINVYSYTLLFFVFIYMAYLSFKSRK